MDLINGIFTECFIFQSTGPIGFLQTALWSNPVSVYDIFRYLGFCLVYIYAALRNVPTELYEASAIDGASPVRQFFAITIPLISPTTFYLIIVRLINVFQIFAAINIITSGGKSGGNVSIVVLIYEEAFKNYNFGYASAEAWILVLLIFGVTLIQFWGQKKWVHY